MLRPALMLLVQLWDVFSGFPTIITLDAAAPARCSLDINLIALHQISVVLSLLPFPFLILKDCNIDIRSPRAVPLLPHSPLPLCRPRPGSRRWPGAPLARDPLSPGITLARLKEMLSLGFWFFGCFSQCSPSPLQSAFCYRSARGFFFFPCVNNTEHLQ